MPPDLPNEQELMLKKRARRRLVGAIALVLLMVIVLPQILQDRATMAQQEDIKITMPDTVEGGNSQSVEPAVVVKADPPPSKPEELATEEIQPAEVNVNPKPPVEIAVVKKEPEEKKTVLIPPSAEVEKKTVVKAPELKDVPKQNETFMVQVGVYSDLANVKRLQDQLKQAGFSTYTEKIKTPKGESVRLKTGKYASRQDAVTAIARLKEIGLPGIVVGNE